MEFLLCSGTGCPKPLRITCFRFTAPVGIGSGYLDKSGYTEKGGTCGHFMDDRRYQRGYVPLKNGNGQHEDHRTGRGHKQPRDHSDTISELAQELDEVKKELALQKMIIKRVIG